MMPFAYRNGSLYAEDVPLTELAAAYGTPLYVYAATRLRANAARLRAALPEVSIHYAVKANANQAVLTVLGKAGLGADIVSGGELQRVLAAGIPADRVVFSGVGKTEAEVEAALTAGIHQLNVESLPELELISRVATRLGKIAPLAFRLNPDVAADTHHKIATGRKGDKFGIDHEQALEAAALAARLPGLSLVGVAIHIGSQLFDLGPLEAAYTAAAGYVRRLREAGHAITRLDLGGGLGVPYRGEAPFDLAGYAAMLRRVTAGLDCALALEPGRYVVADAGLLLARIVHVKQGVDARFWVLDAAMNDLIRPALYESWHTIRPVRESAAAPQPTDVVGPVCESGDVFAHDRPLPPAAAGDLVVLDTAGAYGAVMASTYNARPLVAEALVEGNRHALVRPPLDVAAQIGWDRVPDWV